MSVVHDFVIKDWLRWEDIFPSGNLEAWKSVSFSGSVCLCSNEEGHEFWAQLLL